MNPMTMLALSNIGMQAAGIGSAPQVGPAAPPFQPKQSPGLLGMPSASDSLAERLAQLNQPKTNVVQDAMQAAAPKPTMGPTANAGAMMQASEGGPMGFGDRVGGFMGNLNDNLATPAGQLGLGVLGRIHPLAPYAGLLGMGMFGENKVF